MNKILILVLSGLGLGAANSAWATTFTEACPDLPTCAKAVSELTGQQYIFDADLKGAIKATPNLMLTKDNADVVFTGALAMAGYTRVALVPGKTYAIFRQRDARDLDIPVVTADYHSPPDLPATWDLMTLEYKAANPRAVDPIARLARSFMPANARIISVDQSGTLLVTDTAPNLKKVYELVKSMDVKPTAEVLKKWEEDAKFWQKKQLIEAEDRAKPPSAVMIPGNEHH